MKKSCDSRPQLEIKKMASLSGEGIKHFLLLMNLEVVNQVWGEALRQIQLQSTSPERIQDATSHGTPDTQKDVTPGAHSDRACS